MRHGRAARAQHAGPCNPRAVAPPLALLGVPFVARKSCRPCSENGLLCEVSRSRTAALSAMLGAGRVQAAGWELAAVLHSNVMGAHAHTLQCARTDAWTRTCAHAHCGEPHAHGANSMARSGQGGCGAGLESDRTLGYRTLGYTADHLPLMIMVSSSSSSMAQRSQPAADHPCTRTPSKSTGSKWEREEK